MCASIAPDQVHLVAAERIAASADPDELASFLFGSVFGYFVQRLLLDDLDPDSYAAGLAALVATLRPS